LLDAFRVLLDASKVLLDAPNFFLNASKNLFAAFAKAGFPEICSGCGAVDRECGQRNRHTPLAPAGRRTVQPAAPLTGAGTAPKSGSNDFAFSA
jgi:hypothetical protein